LERSLPAPYFVSDELDFDSDELEEGAGVEDDSDFAEPLSAGLDVSVLAAEPLSADVDVPPFA
jgi:hypothetical protein